MKKYFLFFIALFAVSVDAQTLMRNAQFVSRTCIVDASCAPSNPNASRYTEVFEQVVPMSDGRNKFHIRAYCAIPGTWSGSGSVSSEYEFIGFEVTSYIDNPYRPAAGRCSYAIPQQCEWGERPDGSCYPQECPWGDGTPEQCGVEPDPDPDPPVCDDGQSWGEVNGLEGCWGDPSQEDWCPDGSVGGLVNGSPVCAPDTWDSEDPQCPIGTTLTHIGGTPACLSDTGPGDGDGDGPGDGDGNGPGDGPGDGDGDGDGDGGSGPGAGPGDGDGDGSASGGGDCVSAPTCEGDPIMCAQLNQQWLMRCGMSDSEVADYTGDVIEGGENAIDDLFDGIEADLQTDTDDTGAQLEQMGDALAGGDAGNFLRSILPESSPCEPYEFHILDNTHTLDCQLFEQFKLVFGYFLAVMTGVYIWSMAVRPVER